MQVHPCSIIRDVEKAAFASGDTTSAGLMEAVIDRIWETLSHLPDLPIRPPHVVVYVGKGNNAGDALGLAARFQCPITLRCICPPEELTAETQRQYALLSKHTLSFSAPKPQEGILIIDGLLGSGAHGELKPEYTALVQELNALRDTSPRSATVSIDIPTGFHADTGITSTSTVHADATAVIGCVKPGMLRDGAENYVGRILCIPLPELKLPQNYEIQVSDESVQMWLPRRHFSCYKNLAGRVNIVAGSIGYIGAAHLCSSAAVHAGAGLVTLYCPEEIYTILATRVEPEVMVQPIKSYSEVPLDGAQTMVIGPGLGQKHTGDELTALETLISSYRAPLVLDADALNLIAANGWQIPPQSIITPHPGEMRRLYPCPSNLPRLQIVRNYLANHPCTLLLKGARSIISDGSATWYNSTGGPYMANGGQGDALSGVIGALLAQGLPPLQAATLAAYRCGLAAARAWRTVNCPAGIQTSEMIKHLPQVS